MAEQDRGLWNTRLIADGVDVLQAVLVRDRLGEFQAQADGARAGPAALAGLDSAPPRPRPATPQ
ncbi:hypothetical protein [Nonomuraea sp. SBT364]|uniref:hypothetical protein n=1 Tax=Nonomuraea sp. SBT364 TaxID=1580530 RepID=UPI00066E1347